MSVIKDLTKTAMITKRKGGRNSKGSMKENKSRSTQKNTRSCSNKPTENVCVNGIVSFPSTLLLEKETLSTTAIEDRMVLDQYGEDKERTTHVVPSPCQDISVEGMLGSSEERESLVTEEGTIENSMQCPSGNVEKGTSILAPFDSTDSSEIEWFNDILDSELL